MAGPVLTLPAGERTAHVVVTDRSDGDLSITCAADELATRRAAVVASPWTWLHQVHGATVVAVERAGDGAGREGDAAVTSVPDAVLAIQVADCAPVAFVGADGVVGIAHVGWRGLVAGTLVAVLEAMGSSRVGAVVGPCIHAGCYEFGADDLDRVAEVAGPEVRSRSMAGAPALDLRAGIAHVLRARDVTVFDSPWDRCTACSPEHWSHRARGDRERQAMVVWMTEP